jgi:SSS family solute:Na+ symporter
MIGFGLMWDHFRTSNLFDLVNQVAISLGIPISIPLFLGLFYRRTPPWTAWSTVLVGLGVSLPLNALLKDAAGKTSLERFQWIPGLNGPFTAEENTQFALFATVFSVTAVCTVWFFFTSLFYERTSAEYKRNVAEFFTRLKTPVHARTGEAAREDHAIAGSIGKLLLLYGGFVMVLAAIPNSAGGRLCFIGCGGVMVLMGLLIIFKHREHKAPLLAGERKE